MRLNWKKMDKFVLKCRLFETCKTIYRNKIFNVLNQFMPSFFIIITLFQKVCFMKQNQTAAGCRYYQ